MDSTRYDVAVIGAGVQGSSTAYYLTQKAGIKKVLLLEQFSALHIRGSSHGSTRITRRAYLKPYYVKMMNEAFPMWAALEQESGVKLYEKTGILVLGPKQRKALKNVAESLEVNHIPHQRLTASEVNQRYHRQLSLPPDYIGVFEEDGGILMASKAVAAYQKMFVSAGGVLLDEHPVTEIVPGQTITIRTTKGTFRTNKLVITAGPWASRVLKPLGVELPLKVYRTEIVYWKAEVPEYFSKENFPVFIDYLDDERNHGIYGIPIHEYPGLVKVCSHHGEVVDPEFRDAHRSPASIELGAEFIRKFFKGVSTTPSMVESCIYTETSDMDSILDRHPRYSNIVFGAGFSGHGFKLSPVIGKLLSELALDRTPSYDLSPFKLSRFQLRGNL